MARPRSPLENSAAIEVVQSQVEKQDLHCVCIALGRFNLICYGTACHTKRHAINDISSLSGCALAFHDSSIRGELFLLSCYEDDILLNIQLWAAVPFRSYIWTFVPHDVPPPAASNA